MSSSATPGGGVVSIALVWSPKIQQTFGILIRKTKVLRNGTMHTVKDVQLYINKPGEGGGERGLKTTSNSRAADTHSLPVLLSSPTIKGTH